MKCKLGVLGVLVFLFASSHAQKLSNYLPLNEGKYYKFEVVSGRGGYARGSTEWTMLAARELNGRSVRPRRVTPNGGASFINFLEDDGRAICVVATQKPNDPEPIKQKPLCLLKAPLSAGATWSTNVYVPGSDEPLLIQSTIETLDETVTVPAGTFRSCLRVHSRGSRGEHTLEDIFWYAPEIGVIKFIRKEEGATTVSSQLAAYN